MNAGAIRRGQEVPALIKGFAHHAADFIALGLGVLSWIAESCE
jgi:hypothetical protein